MSLATYPFLLCVVPLFATAQLAPNTHGIPDCPMTVALNYAMAQGLNCNYDPACYCKNSTFIAALKGLWEAQCSPPDVQAAQSFASRECSVATTSRSPSAANTTQLHQTMNGTQIYASGTTSTPSLTKSTSIARSTAGGISTNSTTTANSAPTSQTTSSLSPTSTSSSLAASRRYLAHAVAISAWSFSLLGLAVG